MLKRLIGGFVVVTICGALFGGTAGAHVVVKPAEVPAASFQTFNAGVPNEKDVPVTGLKVIIPQGLKHVSPTVKSGWQIDIEKEGQDEAATVKSISWTGGSIPAGFRDDFTFSAQAPAKAGELRWKAYQTYQDGQVVAWDLAQDKQPKKQDGSPDFSASGPYSVTKLTDATSVKIQTASNGSDWALPLSIVALVLALGAVLLVIRKA